MSGSRIRDGEAGDLFSNSGGVMTLTDIDVQGGAQLSSIVTTTGVGATFISELTATNSSVDVSQQTNSCCTDLPLCFYPYLRT